MSRGELVAAGPFSLEAAAGFGFGPTGGNLPAFDGALRLAFAVDGGQGYAGVVLRQPTSEEPLQVDMDLTGGAGAERAMAQAARILSLDHDGEAFLAVGQRDPVIAALQRAHPGQRPVLFHSPYEAAAWSIISARRPQRQASAVREAIAASLGVGFELAGRQLHAFPQPDRLLELREDTPGLHPEKLARLRGVAQAALDGALDVGRIQELGPERAHEELQRLPGIGPFYSGLIVLRASGFADAGLPMAEPRLLRNTAELYGLPGPPSLEEFTEMAERWRPFRTWASVLIRLGGDRARGS